MSTTLRLTIMYWLLASCAWGQPTIERIPIVFTNDGIYLAGTVVAPTDSGPVPGMVLIHGSGPGERDHLLDIATQFATKGIAVLIYDKRGSGESSGNWTTSSLSDLAEDATAAFAALTSLPQVDAVLSGYWGISQGGWIVPLAANMSSPAFAIVITGGGSAPNVVEAYNYRSIVRSIDDSQKTADEANEVINSYFAYLSGTASNDALMLVFDRFRNRPWFAAMDIESVVPNPNNRKNWEWVSSFDPRESIEKLTIPVLVLLGGIDPLTPTAKTEHAWRESFSPQPAGSEVIVFDNAGHGMRTRGHSGEYISGYFSTQFDWLKSIHILN